MHKVIGFITMCVFICVAWLLTEVLCRLIIDPLMRLLYEKFPYLNTLGFGLFRKKTGIIDLRGNVIA